MLQVLTLEEYLDVIQGANRTVGIYPGAMILVCHVLVMYALEAAAAHPDRLPPPR